jgi:hypothetical protein
MVGQSVIGGSPFKNKVSWKMASLKEKKEMLSQGSATSKEADMSDIPCCVLR